MEREVKAHCTKLQRPDTPNRSPRLLMPPEHIDQRSMFHQNPFGIASGTRGVDAVGQIVGRNFCL